MASPMAHLPSGKMVDMLFSDKISPIGIIQKRLHRLTERSHATSHKSERAGTFSGVTGGRAPSFHDLSVGEAPAPLPQEAENGGGGKFPSQISRRKDQPVRLGTQEKAPVLSGGSDPMQTLLDTSHKLVVEIAFQVHSGQLCLLL